MTTEIDYGPRNPRAMDLARIALWAAVRDDNDRAVAALKAINEETGGEGLMDAILGWCDTAIAHIGIEVGKPVKIAWMEAETQRINSGPDEVRPTARWAGRLLAARAADDHDTFMALIDTIPGGPKDVGDHVWELVQMVALNLRAQQSGETPR
ncbi:hypothetical protein ETD86_37005 [Nonomuraea turkmeniaca]|uniref:Uncharacterized protein n=1 Tax=Nonomuraea turkmeniaca TaxID=103838 RepID=A0A5S4F4Q9_9ACTN|nr:hypothetical protein [Nonomuraea turkmeniaca]TMR11047.1 hypothetical protein ETD86_37005 [Nonomuraea turkmeniaca]